MVQVRDRLSGLFQSIGSGGKLSFDEWSAHQLALQRGKQEADQDAQRFAMLTEDRARGIRNQEEDRKLAQARAKLDELAAQFGIVRQEQQIKAGEQALQQDATDQAALADVDPFEVLEQHPELPEEMRPGIEHAGRVASGLSPEARRQFVAETMPLIQQGLDMSARKKFKAGLADRASRGAYGEDESIGEALKGIEQLVDAGAPLEQVVQQDTKLRMTLAQGQAALAKKQRVLGFLQQSAAGLPPGQQADQAEQLAMAYQAELVNDEQAQQALQRIMFGEQAKPKAPRSASELWQEAARLSRQLHGRQATSEQLMQGAESIYQRLLQADQPPSGADMDPMGPLTTPAGKREAAAMQQAAPNSSETPNSSIAPNSPGIPDGSPAAPATPAKTAASVQQAQALTASKTPTDPTEARAAAVKALQAGDKAKAIEILRAAGLDPDAPAPAKPKPERRTTERVGPNT